MIIDFITLVITHLFAMIFAIGLLVRYNRKAYKDTGICHCNLGLRDYRYGYITKNEDDACMVKKDRSESE